MNEHSADPGSIEALGLSMAGLSAPVNPQIHDIKIAREFIQCIQNATLDESRLSPAAIERLRNPPCEPLPDIDRLVRFSIDLYLATESSSQQTYDSIRRAHHQCYPNNQLLSYDQVKSRIAEITGVYLLPADMCPGSCLAYTGPFENAEKCPTLDTPRYDQRKLAASRGKKKVGRLCQTIPLGPQLQVFFRAQCTAEYMEYRINYTRLLLAALRSAQPPGVVQENEVFPDVEDIFSGSDYLDAVNRGNIKEHDIVVMMSIDGAELYQSKQSDCWIYIWVILELSPDQWYKKKYVSPGGYIPGPNKPKNIDSFLFPGMHHVAALQREGLVVWDGSTLERRRSDIYIAIASADSPGMAFINGLVGHHGGHGCRIYCGMKGHHKDGGTHYFPTATKPHNFAGEGCDHDNINYRDSKQFCPDPARYQANLRRVEQSPNQTQYRLCRLATGIVRPLLFNGLSPRKFLGIPNCFVIDLMHLVAINIPEHLIGLWRGSLYCEPTDDKRTWAWATLQGSVWKDHGKVVAATTPYFPSSFDCPIRNPAEKINSGFKAWEFLLYFFAIVPAHFCKLRRISIAQLKEAHIALVTYVEEFEALYYQRREDRLHVVRQSIHLLIHVTLETFRLMKQTIGNLGEEIRQPSNPFANLAERGLRRSHVNALKAMYPTYFDKEQVLPRNSVDLGDSYRLLHAQDNTDRPLRACEVPALAAYFVSKGVHQVRREVVHNVALVSIFSDHDISLYEECFETLLVCRYQGDAALQVVDIKHIVAVVVMIPFPLTAKESVDSTCADRASRFYVAEKPGLDVANMSGVEDIDNETLF
ncbi:hypothetical protein K474DRAFT_1684384 [Panus rudis PR-1116 ss-1]|nr:hypothetical protein K474DRAFT_1684384 [Panus rudis PR-1116 ss-1]